MEFKSLRNIESSFEADTPVRYRLPLAVRRGDGVERVELLPLRREATGEDLCAGQRQEPDARLVTGPVAEPPGGGTGACAPLPRAVLHALTRKKRD